MKLPLLAVLLLSLTACDVPLEQSSSTTKTAAVPADTSIVVPWAVGSYDGVLIGNVTSDPGTPATSATITFSIANDTISGSYTVGWSGGSDTVSFSGPITQAPGSSPQFNIHVATGGVTSDLIGAVHPAASGNPPYVGITVTYSGNGKGITVAGNVSRNPAG
jgi:hypothetical protein